MSDELKTLLGIVSLIPILAYLVVTLHSRVQARTLEFMLALIVATMPMGILLNAAKEAQELRTNSQIEKVVFIGLVAALVLFGASLWALSASRRVKETRTFPRLGIMLIGWMTFASLVAPSFFGAYVEKHKKLYETLPIWTRALIAVLALIVGLYPLVLAIRMELRCWKVEPKPITPDDSHIH
jgi:hypothetical protein